MHEIDVLAWIYIKNKQFLTVISKGKDALYLPGGKREATETDQQALTREVKEELSVDLIPDSIRYLYTVKAQAHGKPEGVIVKMTCYLGEFTGTINPDNEIASVSWVDSKTPDSKIPPGVAEMRDFLLIKNLID